MQLVNGLPPIQSGDDTELKFNISTTLLSGTISDYDAFWELRKTLKDDPEISKTSAGEYPQGILPDININSAAWRVEVKLHSEDTLQLYGEYTQYLYFIHKTTYEKKSILYGPLTLLEGFDTEYPDTHYCTPEDIAAQMKMLFPDGSKMIYTESTSPSRSDVINMILQAEMQIDRETKDSWRINKVVSEYHDIKMPLAGLPKEDLCISLEKRSILAIDPDQGDSIKFWTGSSYEDYALKPIQRGNTWWVDYNIGQLHFNDMWPWLNTGPCRIECNYRWGATEAPDDIKMACIMLVTIRLLQSDFNKIYIMNQKPPLDWSSIIEDWREQIKAILSNRKRKIFAIAMR